MAVAHGGAHARAAEAVILDDAGALVARRTVGDPDASACLPLAHAVAAWASLVLDAELAREKDDDGGPSSSPGRAAAGGFVLPAAATNGQASSTGLDGTAGTEPDVADARRSPSRRTVDLGTMLYLESGLGRDGGLAGVSPFVTVSLWSAWVLRSAVSFGRAPYGVAPAEGGALHHGGSRVDMCRRIPGNYVERRGVELDLCAGTEWSLLSNGVARAGIGPAVNLRGELGGGLALELRSSAGLNVVATEWSRVTPAFLAAELGLSWRLP